MRCKIALSFLILGTLTSLTMAAAPDPSIVPIKELKVKPEASAFKAGGRNKPITIKSQKDAKKHFSEESLKALAKAVDFKQQVVLVFAWRGSGQDKLSYDVAESFPEQVQFKLTPGRTRDLRPHLHVYALRSNVKWSVK